MLRNNSESINFKVSAKSLFPEGVCSAPPYLHHLFDSMYGIKSSSSQKHQLSQIAFSKRVDKILDQKARAFMNNPPLSGKALQDFMCDLLAEYKCPTNKKPSDLLNEINYPYGSRKLEYNSTTFCFCDGLSQSVAAQRKLINFVTVRNMYATYFSREKSCSITVGEFCQRAQSFFGIDLVCDNDIQNYFIARISLEKDLKGSQNNFFTHFLSFLECHKEKLYSLYWQLLRIIYTKKIKHISKNMYKKRKLNAIFLLSFLIGSNVPMFHGTGGAFVSDAMLQILLVSAGFSSISKNFLGLTEIELLFKFAKATKESWGSVQVLYLEAQHGKTNALFHPQSSGPRGLLHFLRHPFFKTLFFLHGENNTIDDFQTRKYLLKNVTGYEQRNPEKVYKDCYFALQFNLCLFIDNFSFIRTADLKTEVFRLFENHFGISFQDNKYFLRMLLDSEKLTEAQHIKKSANGKINNLTKMRALACISALFFMCFSIYENQYINIEAPHCFITSYASKDKFNNFFVSSTCYFNPLIKSLIFYLITFFCAVFAQNKNKELKKALLKHHFIVNNAAKKKNNQNKLGSLTF